MERRTFLLVNRKFGWNNWPAMYAFEHLEFFDLVNNNIKKKRSVENPALITD